MSTYYYTLTPDDNETLLVLFPDIPEAAAVAESEIDAPQQATDGLEAALQMYVDARRPIPSPHFESTNSVTLGVSVTAKLLLSDAMVSQGIRKADLARLLNMHSPQVDRLLDLGHSSKVEAVESALHALGHRLEVALA